MERSPAQRQRGTAGRLQRRRRSVLLSCSAAAMGAVIPACCFAGLSMRSTGLHSGPSGVDQRERSSLLASPGALAGAGGGGRSPLVAPWVRGQRTQTAAVALPLARVTSKPKQFLIPAGLGLILGATLLLRLVVGVGLAILSLMGKPMLYLAEVALPSDSSRPEGPNPIMQLAGGVMVLWSLSYVVKSLGKLCLLVAQFVGSQKKVLLVVLVPLAWVALRRARD